MICSANQLIGFNMMTTLAFNELSARLTQFLAEVVKLHKKASVFGVFLVRIFRNLDWIDRFTDQKNSQQGRCNSSLIVFFYAKKDAQYT